VISVDRTRGAIIGGVCVLAALILLCVSAAMAQAASPAWRVIAATGPTNLPPVTSEVQKLEIEATAGTFTATFEGQATAALAFNISAADFKTALDGLTTIGGAGGSVEVSGGPGDAGATKPYFVRFRGSLAGTDVAPLTVDGTSLGGGSATVSTETGGGLPGEGLLVAYVTNVGGMDSVGDMTITVGPLPIGIETAGSATGTGWSCLPAGAGQTTVTCTRSSSVPALTGVAPVKVPLRVTSTAEPTSTVLVSAEGGGAAVDPLQENTYLAEINVSEEKAEAGIQAFWAGAFDEDGKPATEAGAHPNAAGTMFLVNTNLGVQGNNIPAADLRDLKVDLPPGFTGNPMVTAKRCPRFQPGGPGTESPEALCDPGTAGIGRAYPITQSFGNDLGAAASVVNTVPPIGYAAQFTFNVVEARATALASLRSDEDFGVRVTAPNIPTSYRIMGSLFMLEGNPPAAEGKPFLTNPTDCAHEALFQPVTDIFTNSWQASSVFDTQRVSIAAVKSCDKLALKPNNDDEEEEEEEGDIAFDFAPEASWAATATAAEALVSIDQEALLDPEERTTPHLKRSVVTLPVGMVLNPSAAAGLGTCSTQQIGLLGTNFLAPNPIRFSMDPATCPDASKIGTVEVTTPLLDKTLEGTVYLAAQNDNPFNSLLAMYIVVEDEETGITLKLPGKVLPNPTTGQLTAEFDNNPQTPFEELKLNFRGGGPRSTMATPDVCATYTTNGSFTPWSAPESGPPAETVDSFTINQGVGGSASCPKTKAERPFALGFEAGSTSPVAGGHSPFTLRITRPDGAQEIDKVSVSTPPGFAATLAGVPVCPDSGVAQALARSTPGDGKTELDAPSCPAASQVGTTTIGAGVGSEPFYVKTGKVYRTGAYNGAKQSLTFIVPAVAGPFDLGVQVVRTALRVNPVTAQITAESDPIPQILQGIPLQIRDIRVDLDRPNFTINPTNCNPMAVSGQITGGSGAVANVSNRFQVDNCAALGFKPHLKLTYKGATKRGGNPSVRAVLTQPAGQANISYTQVVLPLGSFIDNAHINNPCTRAQFAANACPRASIMGYAKAWSPLLDQPLTGNVYFRSNGGERELPDLVAVLQGEVDVELVGFIDAIENKKKGTSRVRNTFAVVPDAPVSRFELNMKGGKFGLIENSKHLCKGKNKATVRMSAHNGRTYKFTPNVATDCRKKGGKGKGKGKGKKGANAKSSWLKF
jgi:hypothetical protein